MRAIPPLNLFSVFVDNCVYIIECTHCHLVYIGEMSRTVGSRIKEHVRMEKLTIYQHLVKHTNTSMIKDIS